MIYNMSLGYSEKNQQKLKQYLASQKKKNDVKSGNKKDSGNRGKSSSN